MPLSAQRPTHVTVARGGRTWSGQWYDEGAEVCVASAYGSAKRRVGRRRPAAVAAELLAEIVDAWLARRPKATPKPKTPSGSSSRRSRRTTTATGSGTASR